MLLVVENIFSLSAPRASSIRRAPFALSPPPLEEASTPFRSLFLHASGRRGPISQVFAGAAPQCPPSHVFEALEETLQQQDEHVANQLDLRHIWIQELQLKYDCDACTLSRQDGAEQLVRSSATDAAASPAPTPPIDLPPRYQAEEANALRKQVEQISALPISSSSSSSDTDNAFAAAMSQSFHPSSIPSPAPPSSDSADLDSATTASKPDPSQVSTSLFEAICSHTVIGGIVHVKAARDVASDMRATGVHGSSVICEGSQSAPTAQSDAVDKNTAPAIVSFENQEENNALFNGTECELGCCIGSVKTTCKHLEINSDARDIDPTQKQPSLFRRKSAEFGHLFEMLILVTCIAVHVWHNPDLLCRNSLLKENMRCTTDVFAVLWPLTFIFVLVFARLWEYLINQCSKWRLNAHEFCAHLKSHLLNVPLSLMANSVMSSCIPF